LHLVANVGNHQRRHQNGKDAPETDKELVGCENVDALKPAQKKPIKECQIVLIDVMSVPREDKTNSVDPVLGKKVKGIDCLHPEIVPVSPPNLDNIPASPTTSPENLPEVPQTSSENPLGSPPINSETSQPKSSENFPVITPISSSNRPVSPKTFLHDYYAKKPIIVGNVTASPSINSHNSPSKFPCKTNACSGTVVCNMCIQQLLDVAE
jgi:hypothetical protein